MPVRKAVAPKRRGGGGSASGGEDPALAAWLAAPEPVPEPEEVHVATRLRWATCEAREFVRYPGGGSGVPEDDPLRPSFPTGMQDALPVRDPATGELTGMTPLPLLARPADADVVVPRSAVKGARGTDARPVSARRPVHADVVPLGSVTDHQAALRGAKAARQRQLLADLASPRTRKAIPMPLRQMVAQVTAASPGAPLPLPLFRQLTLPERRALFERDLLEPGLISAEELAGADAAIAAEYRALLAGRKASNVGCTCAFLPGLEVVKLPLKKIKAALAGAGLPTDGTRAALQLRLLDASRARAGCMAAAPLPRSRDAAAAKEAASAANNSGSEQQAQLPSSGMGEYLHPHSTCTQSRHLTADEPLARARQRGAALEAALRAEDAAAAAAAAAKPAMTVQTPPADVDVDTSEAGSGSGGASASASAGSSPAGASPGSSSPGTRADAGTSPASAAAVPAPAPAASSSGYTGRPSIGGARLLPPADAVCPCEASGVGCHWGTCFCCQDCCGSRPPSDPSSATSDPEADLYRGMVLMLLRSGAGAEVTEGGAALPAVSAADTSVSSVDSASAAAAAADVPPSAGKKRKRASQPPAPAEASAANDASASSASSSSASAPSSPQPARPGSLFVHPALIPWAWRLLRRSGMGIQVEPAAPVAAAAPATSSSPSAASPPNAAVEPAAAAEQDAAVAAGAKAAGADGDDDYASLREYAAGTPAPGPTYDALVAAAERFTVQFRRMTAAIEAAGSDDDDDEDEEDDSEGEAEGASSIDDDDGAAAGDEEFRQALAMVQAATSEGEPASSAAGGKKGAGAKPQRGTAHKKRRVVVVGAGGSAAAGSAAPAAGGSGSSAAGEDEEDAATNAAFTTYGHHVPLHPRTLSEDDGDEDGDGDDGGIAAAIRAAAAANAAAADGGDDDDEEEGEGGDEDDEDEDEDDDEDDEQEALAALLEDADDDAVCALDAILRRHGLRMGEFPAELCALFLHGTLNEAAFSDLLKEAIAAADSDDDEDEDDEDDGKAAAAAAPTDVDGDLAPSRRGKQGGKRGRAPQQQQQPKAAAASSSSSSSAAAAAGDDSAVNGRPAKRSRRSGDSGDAPVVIGSGAVAPDTPGPSVVKPLGDAPPPVTL